MLRYVSKWARHTLIILGVLLGLSSIAFAQTDLERGIYTLTNNVTHDNAVGQGMARSYTEEQSDLTVAQDGLWLTLGFNNTQYMGEFTIKVNGSSVGYDIVSNSNNIKKLKFKIPNLDASIGVGMHVVPMNTDVEYKVTLNQGSLKLIEKEAVEEVKPEEPVTKPESNSGSSSQTGSSSENNTQNEVKPSAPVKPQGGTSSNTASDMQSSASGTGTQVKPEPSKPQSDNNTQIKAEEETQQTEDSIQQDEDSKKTEENQELTAEPETEELIDESSEEMEMEVLSEEEAVQEILEEETGSKGNKASMIIMIIVLIALAAGSYYWYLKMKK